jgi:phage tail sheath gpL-like
MRRVFFLPFVVAIALVVGAPSAWAGSPHFVSVTATRSGDSLVVKFKEAGLGNEPQVHIVVTATAECINGGGNHPKAANKQSVTSGQDFPVQNGRAEGSLTVTASFTPECSPPMTIRFSNVTITDTTSGVSAKLSGRY